MGSASGAIVLSLLTPASIVAPFLVDLLLFFWRKEAAWNFLEELVRYLLGAVADSFECQHRHLLTGPLGLKSGLWSGLTSRHSDEGSAQCVIGGPQMADGSTGSLMGDSV